MLPSGLIDVRAGRDGALTPRYLSDRDHAWVRELQDVFAAAVGEPRHVLDARLRAVACGPARPRSRRALEHVLTRLHGFEPRAGVPPREIRRVVFDLAAGADAPAAVWTAAAARLGLAEAAVRRELYADLPAFRRLVAPRDALSTSELIERYNLRLAQALLFRAEALTVSLRGQVKQVLRFARLQQLLVQASRDPEAPSRTTIEVSGPLSLFRFTTKYGRAMARWLPALTRVKDWRLEARCVLKDARGVFHASDHDPLGTTHAVARRFDSQLEARFFAAISRLAPAWEILREATPATVDGHIACPDFTFVHRDLGVVVQVELVGYWTPSYLARKLAIARALRARGERWLLCLDRRLAAGAELDLPPSDVLFFDRRIRADAVARYLERAATR